MENENKEFYKNCSEYFEYLRGKSTTDYDFEDEYYFTMPAISNHTITDLQIIQNHIDYESRFTRFSR